MKSSTNIAFVQPFGVHSPGGGSRILRMLLQDAKANVVSLATSPEPPAASTTVREIHLPPRPWLGRIEKTRLAGLCRQTGSLFARGFRKKLHETLLAERVSAVHAVAHAPDCLDAFEIASEMKIPYLLSVHDDLIFATGSPELPSLNERLQNAWNGAAARFVISPEMGEEYCRRYGSQSYQLITDGLSTLATEPKQRPSNKLRVYFMGLFHLSYSANLERMLEALSELAATNPAVEITVTCRCGKLPDLRIPANIPVKVLPFASEAEVSKDMQSADLLYMPLPFADHSKAFCDYSLSTKMITYLGSGIPILFHGPSSSAAGKLLEANGAAFCVNSLDRNDIQRSLARLDSGYQATAGAAIALASNQFMAQPIRERFWHTIVSSISENVAVSSSRVA